MTSLKQSRELLGMSQEAIAKQLDISARSWRRYELSTNPPRVIVMAVLALVYAKKEDLKK